MMKRSSSFDDCGGNRNSGGYQHNNNNSMSMPTKTDQQCVEGGDATKGSGSSALSSTRLARAASYGSTNEKQSINNNNNNMKKLVRKYSSSNNSHGFVSDTDGEESELHGIAGAGGRTIATQSSSQLDYQKKRLYIQRLREFDRNANNNCSSSVGDTSLSSSNMSPTPQRFRIHFDNTTATSSVSSSIQSGGKKVKNKVVATRSHHCSITNANNPNRLLELSNINATTDHDEQIAIGEGMHIGEDICSQSTSASDSVVGAKVITTEQYGGETTASDNNQLNIKQWQEQQHHQQQQSQPDSDLIKRSRRKQQGEQKGEPISRPQPHRRVRSGDDWAATIMNPNRDEHWMGMKNLQVVGINKSLPSVPLAERGLSPTSLTWSNNSNDEASSLTRNNSSSLSFQQQQSSSVRSQGATSVLSNSRDGYSAGSSHVTSHRNNEGFIPSGHEQQQRATTRGHSHNKTLSTTFDFSDDSGTGSSGGDNIGSRSGGASGSIPHSSNRLSWDGNDNRRGGYHHVRYASQVIQPVNQPGYINPNMTWLYSYQQSNSHRPIRYDNLRPNYFTLRNESGESNNNNAIDQQKSKEEDNGRSSFSSDGDDDDDDGGSSCMSSSYTDNSTRMIEIEARRAGSSDQLHDHKHHHHHDKRVHFRSLEDTKFDKVMKRVQSVLDKPLYRLDKVNTNGEDDEHNRNIPMFYCPNCKTHQRDFINFATASEGYDSPQGYLVFYFALYLLSSLFIFGLEEGWAPLDCFYFSVITLTTAGLGDFVPVTDGGKIICACFIYFGVATIGLLLGNLLAGSMDKAQAKEAREAQIRDCANCSRLSKLKQRPSYNAGSHAEDQPYTPSDGENSAFQDLESIGLDLFERTEERPTSAQTQKTHTRHMSIDVGGGGGLLHQTPLRRTCSGDGRIPPPIDEFTPFLSGESDHRSVTEPNVVATPKSNTIDMRSLDDTSYSSSSTSTDYSYVDPGKPMTRVKAAKYTFLTLRQALVNSLYIITAGSLGFKYFENLSYVDSFYFTTVLLTSVGYGDIVPVTSSGKLFATIFTVVAGTVLLHNMTLISMIPLELRKRRVEHAVLRQFGSQLTDDELRELSTGRLVNRLKLATNRPDGLEECTREMFSLAMLVRLGRCTENDIKATFAAFRRLDVGNYGTLNSRSIIEGELMRRKSIKDLAALAAQEEWEQRQDAHLHYQDAAPYTSDFTNGSPYRPSHQRTLTPIHHGSPGSFYGSSHGSPNRSLPPPNNLERRTSHETGSSSPHDYEHWQYYSPSQKNRQGAWA